MASISALYYIVIISTSVLVDISSVGVLGSSVPSVPAKRALINNNAEVSANDIAFAVADLTATIETPSGEFHLEAYKSVHNDAILLGGQSARYSQLLWVSFGQPTFVLTSAHNNNNVKKLFHLTDYSFYAYIQMLTAGQRRLLAETASAKYHANISPNQIVNLILLKLECSLIMYKSDGHKSLLKGLVTDFRHFPLRMDFPAPKGSYERKVFADTLETDDKNTDFQFSCNMASQGKRKSTNMLTISSELIERIGLEDKLFGPSNSGSDSVFVTRHQMTTLAAEMYSTLNIVEDYEMPETQFSEAFVEGLINQAAVKAFEMVPIDVAVATLTKYGLNFESDLKPDEIKRDLGEILKIEKIGEKSHIVLDNFAKSKLEQNNENSAGAALKFMGVEAAVNYAKKNQKLSELETKSLNDQLRELNTLSQNEIRWEREGNKVIPKSINVAKIARKNFARTLSFQRVRMVTFEAPFQREFSLYTNRMNSASPLLEQLGRRVDTLESTASLQNITLFTLNKQLKDVESSVARETSKLGQQFQKSEASWSRDLEQLKSSSQIITNHVNSLLSKQNVRRCRVCFKARGDVGYNSHRQCGGNLYACSNWSDSPGWSPDYWDDTDNRNGGCYYQWMIECQT